MSTRDTRADTGSLSDPHSGDEYTEEQLAAMSRADLDALGARIDHVRVLHLDPGPAPGSSMEKRAIRQVGLLFGLAGLFAFAFIFVYVGSGWFLPDWQFDIGGNLWDSLFTPLLGLTMGLSLLCVGAGIVLFTKKLLPHETSVQDKLVTSPTERMTTAATLAQMGHNSGLARRKLITRSLLLMGAGLGAMLIMPLGGLIKNPNKGNPLGTTSWAEGVRLLRDDGTPIRPGDQEPGSLETVFPAVPGGNREPDAATMLIRLRPEQLDELGDDDDDFRYGDYVAYSKICTHAGCPVSLYEQETGRILCPCHQSQFLITEDARPVFGPATRPLPQLPLGVDDEGFFIALGDYPEAVGPTYWNRERI